MAKRLRVDECTTEATVTKKDVPCFNQLTPAHSPSNVNNILSNAAFDLRSDAKILSCLYSNTIEAKLWATAQKGTSQVCHNLPFVLSISLLT